ncbi:hypothetical protein [Bifidobacterium longum]|uniref:hypothetical protein n=1 Tax=Bifidobacterium longum TaxID=216816 RepID=UPI0010EC179B|nr:hypothetical protein MCC10023_1782 [Bifidobacterium longum subsp. longum]TCF18386.1 hypothetical protein MCC10089_1691 [Bifidobacterium longum subsp. longum]
MIISKKMSAAPFFAEENLKHELNVLLKRGVHGLYLFAVDEGLQQRLKECCIH